MKKFISIVLALSICLSLCACGSGGKTQKAFDAAKEAFGNIDRAYALTEEYGTDIYEAWRLGIYEAKNISVTLLADELNLSADEINAAIDDFTGMKGEGNKIFAVYKDDLFSICVILVVKAYELKGTTEEIKTNLDVAKAQMKEMSEKYSDYEHYSNLKGYYTKTNAFFEFCQNPTGSFEQIKTTLNDYKNDAREFRNDLAYIFED